MVCCLFLRYSVNVWYYAEPLNVEGSFFSLIPEPLYPNGHEPFDVNHCSLQTIAIFEKVKEIFIFV